MKIQINEVWNYDGRSKKLAVIDSQNDNPRHDVELWIDKNRPDLTMAYGMNEHGYHAVQVTK